MCYTEHMLFLALLAIIVPIILIVMLRLSAKVGMAISAVIVALVAWLAWNMTPLAMGASVLQAVHRSLVIGFILFGAVVLLNTLQKTGALMRIKFGFHALSPDMRVQAVLVAFAFVSLIEGISGFGTPAIVAAPLLMVLGFHPIAAATLALLGDTVAVTFGAVGTPLMIGLENTTNFTEAQAWAVGAQVTLFDVVIATILPVAIAGLLIFSFGNQTVRQKWRSLTEIAPWSLMIGVVYALTAALAVRSAGPEFASIIAGAVALGVGMVTVQKQWLTPRTIWRHHANDDVSEEATPDMYEHIPLWKAWLPYGVVIGLLLLTRAVDGVRYVATTFIDASWRNILGVEGISSVWPVLYSPGVVLLVGAVVAVIIGARSFRPLQSASVASLKTVYGALLALVPTLIMVQLFTNSGVNVAQIEAMPTMIGLALAEGFGQFWVVCAPFLGAIGAFIAGSSTVSALTMGPVQESIALSTGLPVVGVLALQMVGAAAGNTLAIHNVVIAAALVGLPRREFLIMRRLIVPVLCYIVIAGVLGLLLL